MKRFFTPTFIKAALFQLLGKNKRVPGFILGSGRCGSSLLVDVLSSNNQIDVKQQEWYRYFLKRLNKGYKSKEFLTDIIDFKRITEKSIKAWTPLDRFYIKAMFSYAANKNADRVYLIKSPAISLMLSEIEQMFPEAIYIHLYRNGYAVVNSLFNKEYQRVKRYQESFSEQEFKVLAARYWAVSVGEIEKFLKKQSPNRVKSLSYEDFTANPADALTNIAELLKVNNNFGFKLSEIKSTNYKISELAKDDISAIREIIEPLHKELGYEPINTN